MSGTMGGHLVATAHAEWRLPETTDDTDDTAPEAEESEATE